MENFESGGRARDAATPHRPARQRTGRCAVFADGKVIHDLRRIQVQAREIDYVDICLLPGRQLLANRNIAGERWFPGSVHYRAIADNEIMHRVLLAVPEGISTLAKWLLSKSA